METIRLTEKEKNIRSWLLSFATGEESKRLERGDGEMFLLNDYEEFQHLVGVSSYDLPGLLQRISLYDFQHGQPLLECQLTDITGGWFDIDCPRDGLTELLDELYGESKLPIRERIARERDKVEWYWRVNKNIPERLIKSLNNEHIIVQQHDLARWTQEDLPGIAMRTASRRIKIRIRYIVFDKGEPRFGYSRYGDFYFLGDRLFIITRDKNLAHLSDPDAFDILSRAALESPNASHYDIDEDFVDEDTGDIVTVHQDAAIYSRNLFRDQELLIVPALFAGMQTNLRDSRTSETLYTGDAVSVKFEGQDDALTAGLGVVPGTEQYGLILDNHGLLIPDEFGRKMKLFRAGSMFYDLDPYEQLLHLNGICCGYYQSHSPKDIKRLQIKSSPCIAKSDSEWCMAIKSKNMDNNAKSEKQKAKARLGAIGEANVASILMQHGWDTFNANSTITNYRSIDLICTTSPNPLGDKPWKPEVTFVQVKTSVKDNITTGFSLSDCLSRNYLEANVHGPYVFVLANESENGWNFRYFVLSRKEFIDLVYESNQFYMNGYRRNGKSPDGKNPAGLLIRWLEGKSEEKTARHDAFNNPLNGVSSEDKWENIWKED